MNRMDVDSADHEQAAQGELHPLIQHAGKIPTRKEARTAHAQSLALCWSLFWIGWMDSSTGPLLPTIQKFYNVFLFFLFELFRLLMDPTGRVRHSVLDIRPGLCGQ